MGGEGGKEEEKERAEMEQRGEERKREREKRQEKEDIEREGEGGRLTDIVWEVGDRRMVDVARREGKEGR